MNAALKTFSTSTMSTLLSWLDDRVGQGDFGRASGSKKTLSRFSLLRFDTQRDMLPLTHRGKIQVCSRRSSSATQTYAP